LGFLYKSVKAQSCHSDWLAIFSKFFFLLFVWGGGGLFNESSSVSRGSLGNSMTHANEIGYH